MRSQHPGASGAPLGDHAASLMSKLGEHLLLRRATLLHVHDPSTVCGVYAHGTDAAFPASGRIAALVAVQHASADLARRVARQVVGMAPRVIDRTDRGATASALAGLAPEQVLLEQPFFLDTEGRGRTRTVREVLGDARVLAFVRYECGEVAPDAVVAQAS